MLPNMRKNLFATLLLSLAVFPAAAQVSFGKPEKINNEWSFILSKWLVYAHPVHIAQWGVYAVPQVAAATHRRSIRMHRRDFLDLGGHDAVFGGENRKVET
jgi:hypothetical protein